MFFYLLIGIHDIIGTHDIHKTFDFIGHTFAINDSGRLLLIIDISKIPI